MDNQDNIFSDIDDFLKSRAAPQEPAGEVTSEELAEALWTLCWYEMVDLIQFVAAFSGRHITDEEQGEECDRINQRLNEILGVDRPPDTEDHYMQRLKLIRQWKREADEFYLPSIYRSEDR